MTIRTGENTTAPDGPPRAALTLAADGSYAARLARHDDAAGSWFPERWTLGGPEPYAVPLAGSQPEEPDSGLLPLADGRVVIVRRVADRFTVSVLSPTGPGTHEVLVGAVATEALALLPPAPGGRFGYALAPGAERTAVWRVHGGAAGPERVAVVPGRCTGGAWLDHDGRLLAVDQELAGRTKAVVVDLARDGEVSPLLQITEESDDRLLLADPDSGLLLVRSNAPGHERVGWGVLGSSRPVRFPECLRAPGATVTPFAVQPGRTRHPESCAVAFRLDGPDRREGADGPDAPAGPRLGVWRPAQRQLRQLPAPEGWLAGSGRWTPEGELLLPYATGAVPCGVARMAIPLGPVAEQATAAKAPEAGAGGAASGDSPSDAAPSDGVPFDVAAPNAIADAKIPEVPAAVDGAEIVPDAGDSAVNSTASPQSKPRDAEPHEGPAHPRLCRPVPLQQAPLSSRESQWSADSRPVSIPAGAVQPVDPATYGIARDASRREPGEVPTRTAVSDLTE